ncbi:hypothetical protein ACO0QE_002984 [Hanseniaspora vineae]
MELANKYIQSNEEIAYEYDILKDPKNVVTWQRYVDHIKGQPDDNQNHKLEKLCFCFERALHELPQNEDLWLAYLTLLDELNDMDKYSSIGKRATQHCSSSYTIWITYLSSLFDLRRLEQFDQEFTRCLKSIPLADHISLWNETVLAYINDMYSAETEENVMDTAADSFLSQPHFQQQLQRQIKIMIGEEPGTSISKHEKDSWSSFYLTKYAQLIALRQDSEVQLLSIFNMLCKTQCFDELPAYLEKFVFPKTKTSNLYFQYLSCMIYSTSISFNVDLENMIIEAMQTYTSDKKYFILLLCHLKVIKKNIGLSEFYEFMDTLLNTTTEAPIFNLLYDFGLNFEEKALALCSQDEGKLLHLEKLEKMTQSYSIMANTLQLRKYPNKISLWKQRLNLGKKNDQKFLIAVYNEALEKISSASYELEESRSTTGKGQLGELWVSYADVYYKSGDYDNFRQVMNTAKKVPFKYIQDLENIFLYWSDRELTLGDTEQAIAVLKAALNYPQKFATFVENANLILNNYYSTQDFVPAQVILPLKSFSLWDRLLQIYEVYKPLEETNALYEDVITLKVAKPSTFVTFAALNRENTAKWISILNKAFMTFSSSKSVLLELYEIFLPQLQTRLNPRTSVCDCETVRDCFETLLTQLEKHKVDCVDYYLRYARFESSLGNYRKSIDILYRGTISKNVDVMKSKWKLWEQLLAIAEENLGVEQVRSYFKESLMTLPNSLLDSIVVRYAEYEVNAFQQYDNARAILQFGAECGPVQQHAFVWDYWKKFELKYGNKETFKSMLRMKRIVGDKFVVDTQAFSRLENNVEFVSSGIQTGSAAPKDKSDTMEIELDI